MLVSDMYLTLISPLLAHIPVRARDLRGKLQVLQPQIAERSLHN